MSGKNLSYLSVEDFYLQPIYSCIHCRANLAHHSDLISKSFQGSQGRAYLFNNVVNVGRLVAEERMLLTGLHYVADIYCECCSFILGWKYERAFEPNQRYKEGKYIIEQANLIKDNGWDIDYPRIRISCYKQNRKSFSINWDESCDSISKGSFSKQSKSQSKSTFIKDLSRDFQNLFGLYDKSSLKLDQDILTRVDIITFNEDISSSIINTGLERQGTLNLLRVNSDSDNMDSLNNSFVLSNSDQCSDLKVKRNQDLSQISANDSGENSSLNTSYSSSRGLLGASCSSDIKIVDMQSQSTAYTPKPKHHYNTNTNTNTNANASANTKISATTSNMPSTEISLSASGTSAQASQRRHSRQHSRHKSKHQSNVFNPQKPATHRRHRSGAAVMDLASVKARGRESESRGPSHNK